MPFGSADAFGVATSPERLPLPAEIAFLAGSHVHEPTLRRAAALAQRDGVTADRALIAHDLVDDDDFYRSLAIHLDVPFIKHWPALDPALDPPAAARSGTARLAGRDRGRLLVAPSGAALRALLACRGDRRRLAPVVLTTPNHLSQVVQDARDATIARVAADGLPDVAPHLSARGKFDRIALGVAAAAIAATVFGSGLDWRPVADVLGLVFLGSTLLRLGVSVAGLRAPPVDHRPIADAHAPTYTVLVPLYREPAIVPDLVAAMRRLDYPRGKLEILLLLEIDDTATRAALAAEGLPPYMKIIVTPDGQPRTKPRALNVGLQLARGDLLTVFDAEDRPHPLQLRLAAAAFAVAGPDVACLQARLAITNGARGILPRLFALEYATLFDVFNVGIARLGFPMALGGTSNHFKTSVLRRTGGWDAWNVTEDAELGFRLARFGYKTECLASTTSEDAPEKLGVWFRQRRRWMKGWMQTLVVLARDPTARRDFGPGRAALVALLLTNLVTGPLALPYFAALMGWHIVSGTLHAPHRALAFVETMLDVNVAALGLLSTLWCGYLGLRRRRLHAFVSALPLLAPYQLMISAAAWMACLDIIRRPYHWHKTEHAPARVAPAGVAPSLRAQRSRSRAAKPRPAASGRLRSARNDAEG